MSSDISQRIQQILEHFSQGKTPPSHCFLGFDGFTDDILDVVDQRQDPEHYEAVQHIADLGQRISAAAGQSCNIELVPLTRKIGGNGPIMANALIRLGQRISYAGAVGMPGEIEPLFTPLADNCEEIFPLAPSGHSEALEFQDGKIILGKHAPLLDLGYERLVSTVGKERLVEILERSELFAALNWTMLPRMTEIWQKFLEELLPQLSDKPRYFFVDLADPAKRSDQQLMEAMELLGAWSNYYTVILGVNIAEAQRLADLYGLSAEPAALRERLGVAQLVLHNAYFAEVAFDTGSYRAETWHCEAPMLCTGAGDNFNAGYCHGLLTGLDPEHAVLCGMATAGHYIRAGQSATQAELLDFFQSWRGSLV